MLFGGVVVARATIFLTVLFVTNIAVAEDLEEWVTVADGVDLRTQITLPDATLPPYPVLLVRSTYPFDELPETAMAFEYAAMFGYAVAVQYTRGVDGSGGTADAFLSDRADGLATIDWILAQDWCNGDIVMGGVSALGITAYLAAPGAPSTPAGVKCFLMAEATPDVYSHAAFHGGVFKKRDVESWLRWSDASDMLDVLSAHRHCDEYWDPVRVLDMGAQVSTPALHLGGWFDVFTQGTLDGWGMFRQSSDEWVAENQYLIVGPWTHFDLGSNQAGSLTFPENAKWDFVAGLVGWAVWCFEGHQDDVDEWPRVQYYTMGDPDDPSAPGNEWRHSDQWPPEHVDVLYYLGDDDGDVPGVAGVFGSLSTTISARDFLVPVPVDPSNPVPTRGGRNLHSDWGPKDLSSIESRNDVVVFSTPVLDEPVEATGRVRVRLWVSTAGADADLAVRLSDVFPDGRSMLVTEGIQRLSARDGCQAEAAVTPGEVLPVEVDLWSTSWVFNTGHRIRISISGTNSPRYEINPEWTSLVAPGFTLAVGPSMSSALILPVPVTDPDGDAASSTVEAVEVVEIVEVSEIIEEKPEPIPDQSVSDSGIEDVSDVVEDTAMDGVDSSWVEDLPGDLGSSAEITADPGREISTSDDEGGEADSNSCPSGNCEPQSCGVVSEGCSARVGATGSDVPAGLLLLPALWLIMRRRFGA